MSEQQYLRSLLKEAALYRTQGLLVESKGKYLKGLEFLDKSRGFGNHEKLIDAVQDKIQSVEKDLAEIKQATTAPDLSQEVQNLITDLFSFSQTKEAAAVEGAVALVKFGQYEHALAEFQRLLKEGSMPVVAAKNIIRCHISLSSPDAAIAQFVQWVDEALLTKPELKDIRSFLENMLEKKGMKAKLPQLMDTPQEMDEEEEKEKGLLDICTVVVQLEDGSCKDSTVEFDVTFQSGNTISIIIPADKKDLLDPFRLGIRLPDMQFFCPMAVFRGSGMVSGKTKIRHGTKKGDYTLDITIDGL